MGDILLGVSLVAMLVSVVASLIAVRLLRQVERIAALAEHPLYSIDPDHRWPGEIGGTAMTTWPQDGTTALTAEVDYLYTAQNRAADGDNV